MLLANPAEHPLMMGLLIRKEVLTHLLSYRFILTFSLFFVLVVSSVQMIALNYSRQVKNHAETRRAQEEQLRESGDFRRMRWSGIQAEKAPNPLSIFATGLEREMSRSIRISNSRDVKLGRNKYANPLFVLFSAPDLLYIVNIVGSLLALLFAFDAICGEKEEGTLQLMMANSVPRHTILLAKWIGGYAVLALPFLTAILIAVLFAQLTTSLSFTGAEWTAFSMMLAVAALYLSVFFALGMMISALTHSANISLVFNFLIWVVLVLVIPNTAPIVARAVSPVPSAGVMASKREAVQRQVWGEMRQNRRNQRDMSREERGQQRDEIRARIEEETGKILTAYMRKVDDQISMSILLARISPSSNFVYATANIAGSGLDNFASMRNVIDRYRIDFMEWWQAESHARRQRAESVESQEERQALRDAPVDLDDLPQFTVGRAGLDEILVSAQTDLLLLLLLNMAFFMGAYMSFLRYDLME